MLKQLSGLSVITDYETSASGRWGRTGGEQHLKTPHDSSHTMTRVDASLPEALADLLEAGVEDGVFKGPSDAARVATREYFTDDQLRLAAIQALVEASPPSTTEDSFTLADVVRLSGRHPADLPVEIRTHYEIPNEQQDDEDQGEGS